MLCRSPEIKCLLCAEPAGGPEVPVSCGRGGWHHPRGRGVEWDPEGAAEPGWAAGPGASPGRHGGRRPGLGNGFPVHQLSVSFSERSRGT